MNIVWPFKTIQTSKELASIFQPSVIYIGLTPRPRQAYGAWVLSAIVFGLFDSHYQFADCWYQGFSPMKCGHANTVGLSRKKGMNSLKKNSVMKLQIVVILLLWNKQVTALELWLKWYNFQDWWNMVKNLQTCHVNFARQSADGIVYL